MISRCCSRALRPHGLRFVLEGHTNLSLRSSRIVPVIKASCHQPRHLTTSASAKKLFKENPFSVSLASIFILCGAGCLVYANYFYQSYIIGEFKAFPEPVAVKLRRALYYTNIDLQPKNALKYFQQAISVAEEVGMDQFSSEYLEIKLEVAYLLEKVHDYQQAAHVINLVAEDCLKWIELMGEKPGNAGKRRRLLEKTVKLNIKLGELYSSPHILEPELAEEKLVWAVTTLLKEQKRRDEEGVKEDEGPWMNSEEIGASLEAVANHFEQKDRHFLAAPLYLQAIGLIPKTNCHAVVLMNNLSISLAQQQPRARPHTPAASFATLVDNARTWAEKALAVAANIAPPDRTSECDEACAVATINLGEFAAMLGNTDEARRRFEEGKALSRAIKFWDGIAKANEGLKKLK